MNNRQVYNYDYSQLFMEYQSDVVTQFCRWVEGHSTPGSPLAIILGGSYTPREMLEHVQAGTHVGDIIYEDFANGLYRPN